MRRLPFRPAIFIAACALIAVAWLLVQVVSGGAADAPLFAASTLAYVALLLAWGWQATAFAVSRTDDPRASQAQRLFQVFGAVLLAAWAANSWAVWKTGLFPSAEPLPQDATILLDAATLLSFVGMIGVSICAAIAVRGAERAAGLRPDGLWRTTWQFIFLIYTTPILYHRLKALDAPRPEAPRGL
jgi:hypothetical protein